MTDLKAIEPPTLRTAHWLTDEQYGDIRRREVQETPPGHVKLFNPDSEGLRFGAAGLHEDQSGVIAFERGFAVVPSDHPALDLDDPHCIYRLEPHVVLVDDGGPFLTDGETERFVKPAAQRAPKAPKRKPAPRRRSSAAPRPIRPGTVVQSAPVTSPTAGPTGEG